MILYGDFLEMQTTTVLTKKYTKIKVLFQLLHDCSSERSKVITAFRDPEVKFGLESVVTFD